MLYSLVVHMLVGGQLVTESFSGWCAAAANAATVAVYVFIVHGHMCDISVQAGTWVSSMRAERRPHCMSLAAINRIIAILPCHCTDILHNTLYK